VLRRLLPALLLASLAAAPLSARADSDLAAPLTPAGLIQSWQTSEAEIAAAGAVASTVAATPAPADDLFQVARQNLQLENAEYLYRDAARQQQVVVYAMATDPNVEAAVEPFLPAAELDPARATINALRSLWRLAGIDDLSQIRIRHNRRIEDSAPVQTLMGYYQGSGARWSVNWSFLASINYVESDFGRVNGPSSAGALGPMQFMPATWASYGTGDVMNPKDAIEAAAHYLNAMGAQTNMDRAIYRYNNDTDYVAAIDGFAEAFRSDPEWVSRLYYWSTAG
jgi:membrane-bound lytic murein transglycosylase B